MDVIGVTVIIRIFMTLVRFAISYLMILFPNLLHPSESKDKPYRILKLSIST